MSTTSLHPPLENIEDGYFEVDLGGNLTFFNEALGRITGFPHNRLMGMNYRDYTTEETAQKVFRTYSEIFKTGVPVKGFEYAINVNGTEKFIDTSVSPIQDGVGKRVGFRGIIRDVSERKQAERRIRQYSRDLEAMVQKRTESLQRSEEKYRTILENIEDGYYELDLTGNITFVNDATSRITGYSEQELMKMSYRHLTDEKDSPKHYDEYKRVHKTGMPIKRYEWKLIRKDGMERTIETSISLIKDVQGQPFGFRGIIRDVNERKALEGQLMEKSRLAEEANRAKSEFLANLSHEIRTPLNGVIGMAELVLDTRLDPHQKKIFQTINSEANSLLMLINEILDFSKIEAGKVDLEEIPFDLRHTIEDVANSFAYRAEHKGLEFNVFLSPDIPSRLIGDPGRLRQILNNLIGNALKFTHEGEVYVSGEIVALGERIKIGFSIRDTGIGIPANKQKTIFDSFRQADGSTTRKFGGTGLGTTISKQLVEMMGGEISVESREGKGSTFRFTAVFERQKEAHSVAGADTPNLAGLRVLVVDDNRNNRFIQREYLKHRGCKPVLVGGGKEALGIIRKASREQNPFDLILTDFQMPDMDGFDLAQTVRKMDSLKGIPIIILTSVGDRGDGGRCIDTGINGYLTKPVRRDELYQVIEMVMGLSMGDEKGAKPPLVTRHTVSEVRRRNLQILLVEDYPTNQLVAMQHLNNAGYEVELAENGKQALDAFKNKRYDLILMDIQMPVMDGYEATKAIRAIESHVMSPTPGQSTADPARIPIIAMTADAFASNREKCFELGMNDFVSKPLQREKLMTVLEKWIGRTADRSFVTGKEKPGDTILKGPSSEKPDSSGNREKRRKDIPMDFEKAVAEFEGDEGFLVEVLRGFLANAASQIKTIRQAITEKNMEVVRKEAHAIKGGAGNLTAESLSDAAARLETAAKSGTLELGLLENVEETFRRLDVSVIDKYGYERTHGKPS